MGNMIRNLRAFRRSLIGLAVLPVLVASTALQGFIVGPVFNNHTVLPNFSYNTLRRLFGIKVAFSKASAPLEQSRATWFVANHMSIADFIVLGSALKGTFAGKGDLLRWPGVAQMARAVKYIGIRRVNKDDPNFETYHRQTIGKIMKNFNEGHNTIMFPEGTTTDGSQVALFRAGLISLLYGNDGLDKEGDPVRLEREVVVQPIAIKVTEVEGKSIDSREDLRHFYSHYNTENTLKRIWTRLATRNLTIELTAFPPMAPKDYKDQFELINKAGDQIRSVVAPGQTEIRPASIPGVKDRDKPSDPPKPG